MTAGSRLFWFSPSVVRHRHQVEPKSQREEIAIAIAIFNPLISTLWIQLTCARASPLIDPTQSQ